MGDRQGLATDPTLLSEILAELHRQTLGEPLKTFILKIVGVAIWLLGANIARAQTFPNYQANPVTPFIQIGPATGAGPANPSSDYLVGERVISGALAGYGLMPLSAFAGAADLTTTNAMLAVTNSNLSATNINLAATSSNLSTTNANLAVTNQNLLGLRDYSIGVRNLALSIRQESRQSAAAAMALSAAPMPSAPGRTSWTFNAAEFDREPGWGGSIAHRFNTSVPFAVTAGFAFSGSNNGGRIGFSGEF